jgi:hypothetical protein
MRPDISLRWASSGPEVSIEKQIASRYAKDSIRAVVITVGLR